MTGLLLAGTEVRSDPFLHAAVSQVFADDLVAHRLMPGH